MTRIEMERNGLIGINCGGLWQVNEVFQTFLTIEELIQEDLCLEKCKKTTNHRESGNQQQCFTSMVILCTRCRGEYFQCSPEEGS